MILNIGELITKRRENRAKKRKIDIIDNQPPSTSIEEAKAKVQAIIESGEVIRRRKRRKKQEE